MNDAPQVTVKDFVVVMGQMVLVAVVLFGVIGLLIWTSEQIGERFDDPAATVKACPR